MGPRVFVGFLTATTAMTAACGDDARTRDYEGTFDGIYHSAFERSEFVHCDDRNEVAWLESDDPAFARAISGSRAEDNAAGPSRYLYIRFEGRREFQEPGEPRFGHATFSHPTQYVVTKLLELREADECP